MLLPKRVKYRRVHRGRLTGKAMTWNAEGEVSKAPLAAVIENGEYVMK